MRTSEFRQIFQLEKVILRARYFWLFCAGETISFSRRDQQRLSFSLDHLPSSCSSLRTVKSVNMPIELPWVFVAIPRNPVFAVGIPLACGFASGFITRSSVDNWYEGHRKPPGQPPRLAFPIAWTALYAGMGVASHLLISAYDAELPGTVKAQAALDALTLYWIQFGLNMAWTPLFFGAKKPLAALVDIGILTPVTYLLTYRAAQVDSRTSYFLVPYCAWLSYATYLNGGFWYLNFGPGKRSTSIKKDPKDL